MRRFLSLFLLVVLSVPAFSQAKISYSSVVVIGDSLSDTGQFYNTTLALGAGYPSPAFGYTTGRFTDGVDSVPAARNYFGVWHEQLADMLPGFPATQPALKGGTNYAFGSATTADGIASIPVTGTSVSIPVRNMGQQVDDYLAANTPSSSVLYVLWGGANDYLQDPNASASTVASNVAGLVLKLANAGAVNFMVLNVPPTSADVAAITYAAQLRGYLAQDLAGVQQTFTASTLHFFEPDVLSLFQSVETNPSAFGFTNLTTAANTTSADTNPDTYLLWDGLHPTTAGHFWIASAACSTLTQSTIQLTTSASAGTPTSPATLTATIASASGSTTIPTGTVLFYSDIITNGVVTHTLLGSAPLDASGVATLSSTQIPAGNYTISAEYSGDTTYPQGCRSARVALTVTAAPSFTLGLSPASLSASTGTQVSTQVSVVPAGGFAQSVAISCGSPLPQYASCFVTNTPVTINGTTSSTATVTLQAYTVTTASADRGGPLERGRRPMFFFALAPFVFFALRRRRALVRLLAAIVMLSALTAISGCGGGNSVGISEKTYDTPPGTYTIPVIGTAADGTTSTINWSVTLN